MILNKTNSDSGYACLVFGFRNGTSVLLGVFGVVAATLSIHPLLSSASRIKAWSDCIWSITNRFGTTIVAISTLLNRKLFYQTLICRHLPWYKKHIMLTILYTLANTITPSKCDNNVHWTTTIFAVQSFTALKDPAGTTRVGCFSCILNLDAIKCVVPFRLFYGSSSYLSYCWINHEGVLCSCLCSSCLHRVFSSMELGSLLWYVSWIFNSKNNCH